MTQSTAQLRTDGQPSPRAKCPTCKEVFSNVRNFDAHMTPFHERYALNTKDQNRRKNVPTCVDPSTVGLVLSESTGQWVTPQEWRKDD